jgi:methylmalonyl-CoA/ethylmalonyl-CoA epimerase
MTALGYQPVGETFTDPRQGVTGLFLEGSGPRLELLAPLQGSTVLDPWLAVNAKLYHLAYEVPALGQAAAAAKAAGARQVSRPEPAVAFDGRPISFFMLRNRLLIELIEAPARLSRE